MRRPVRALVVAVSAALLAALAGCAAIPTSGSVNPGVLRTAEPPVDLEVQARGPEGGETPQEIFEGFVQAAASPRGNYEVAREFLTPGAEWKADAGTTIDVLADRKLTEVDEDTLVVQVVPSGSLTPNGQYLEANSTTPVQLEYEFEQVDGEWRISSAPPGLLVDETTFQVVYRDYTLAFFDPKFRFVVPDVRWFAGRESAQTSIVRALIEGPVEWLEPGVVSAVPDGVSLDPATVPVNDGVAEVSFTGAAFDSRTVQRLQFQLEQSLSGVRNVEDVQLSLNGVPVNAPDLSPEPERTPRIDPRPVAYDGSAFGHLSASDGGIVPIEGLSEQVTALAPTGAALGSGESAAAVRSADGVWLVRADEAPVPLDPRDGLVVPALDVDGVVWSVPSDAPDALAWFAVDGSRSDQIAVPWSASRIQAIELSRDGTRLVALLADGGRTRVVAASVQRDEDGLPTGLGPVALELAGTAGEPLDVAWLDAGTVGVLTASPTGERLALQELGAPDSAAEAPAGAVEVDGANSQRDVRVLTADGALATRAGAGWQPQDRDLRFLATQQTD